VEQVGCCKGGGICFGTEESQPSVTNVWSSSVLPFDFLRFFLNDIVVGFVGLIFRTQHNESTYDKCLTSIEMIFTKRALPGQLFVKNCHTELHEKPSRFFLPYKVTDGRTDSLLCSARNSLLFLK
jgi:hypothetical protein